MTILRRKWILVTLTCLMLVGLLAMDTTTQTVQAPEYLFTVHLLRAPTPTPYVDMALAYKAELAKIGINLEVEVLEQGIIDDIIWEETTNKLTWDEGGWDMDLGIWWWMPTDLVWFEGCYSSWAVIPTGWNYYGWQNPDADDLLRSCLTVVDPALRKDYAWKWQEEFMHDPPHLTLYYWIRYEVTAADLEGWNMISWFYAANELRRANTTLEDDVTLKWGTDMDLTVLNPMFMTYATDEAAVDLTFNMLMTTRRDPETGAAIVVPSLASTYPVYSPDGKHVTVYLRDDVEWHDGWKFNATDVKFTFDAVVDPATASTGYGDFAPVIDSVEIIGPYTVVFHLKEPSSYFNALLADSFGGTIIPEHVLRDVPHKEWKNHATNTAWPMVGTGPFKFVDWEKEQYWELEANTDYFLGEPMIDHFYGMVITDPHTQLVALQTHQIDFGEGWTATMDEINEMRNDPTLKVREDPVPMIEMMGFNLNHPILSNRYVRQAMAHAVPYEHIINDLVPLLGMAGIRATGPVHPMQGYFYNTELEPFEYDLVKAQQYLDMWKYSQVGTDYTLGPVGDGDFSGFVEMADFAIWADRIVYGQLTPETWPFKRGHPIDPDYDNTGYVEGDDFYRWRESIGEYYPFYGAR